MGPLERFLGWECHWWKRGVGEGGWGWLVVCEDVVRFPAFLPLWVGSTWRCWGSGLAMVGGGFWFGWCALWLWAVMLRKGDGKGGGGGSEEGLWGSS